MLILQHKWKWWPLIKHIWSWLVVLSDMPTQRCRASRQMVVTWKLLYNRISSERNLGIMQILKEFPLLFHEKTTVLDLVQSKYQNMSPTWIKLMLVRHHLIKFGLEGCNGATHKTLPPKMDQLCKSWVPNKARAATSASDIPPTSHPGRTERGLAKNDSQKWLISIQKNTQTNQSRSRLSEKDVEIWNVMIMYSK